MSDDIPKFEDKSFHDQLMSEPGNFYHCATCVDSKPEGVSARDYARLEIFITSRAMWIGCVRHNKEVALISYQVPVE